MSDVLYYGLIRFQRALGNLDRFRQGQDFYDDLDSLERFLWEFIRILPAVEEQLQTEEQWEIYERNRERYLAGCQWVMDRRWDFDRQVDCVVYTPGQKMFAESRTFKKSGGGFMRDDKELSGFLERKRGTVFFSARFSFRKNGSDAQCLDFSESIEGMRRFLFNTGEELKEEARSYRRMRYQIARYAIRRYPEEMRYICDYSFTRRTGSFKRAEILQSRGGEYARTRTIWPSQFGLPEGPEDASFFKRFIGLYARVKSSDIFPAIMTVQNDGSLIFDVFTSDLETTLYRKIWETAEWVRQGRTREVCVVFPCVKGTWKDGGRPAVWQGRYDEGMQAGKTEVVFVKTDKDGHDEECIVDRDRWEDVGAAASTPEIRASEAYMRPIKEAFAERFG